MDKNTKIVDMTHLTKEITGMADPEPRKFKSCHEIFPYWDNCENILTDWFCRCGWWKTTKHFYGYDISLDLPPMSIPEKYEFEINLIINGITLDYIPTYELMPLRHIRMDKKLEWKIKTIIANREKYIMSIGGRHVLAELGFRVGLSVFK